MRKALPANLPKTMPSSAVVDYSGRLSQDELAALNSYVVHGNYSPHVVVLSPTDTISGTQELAFQIAQTWKLEPQGFLVVVNTSNDSVGMVSGTSLQRKGVDSEYVDENLVPLRFEKEYIQGHLAKAIRSTMVGVEQKLNVSALQGDRASHSHHHHNSYNSAIGVTVTYFCLFVLLMIFVVVKASLSDKPRPRLPQGRGYQDDTDLAADLERMNHVLDGGHAVKQVPMKEFAQRSAFNRKTQNSLEAKPAPSLYANQASANVGNYGSQMIAQDAIAERKILAADNQSNNETNALNKPIKLIFEGAAVSEIKSAQNNSNNQSLVSPPSEFVASEASQPVNAFEIPSYKPYEFPQDETVVPSVGSLAPSAELPVLKPGASTDAMAVSPLSSAVKPADFAQTTDNVLKLDQYAQAMKSEPEQDAEPPMWQPASYTMPPAPVLPVAPAMPFNNFAASMNNDFTDVLNRSSSTYASLQQSGFITSNSADASSGSSKEAAAPTVCPQCQSEKSPDFSFCLRCGHMFV